MSVSAIKSETSRATMFSAIFSDAALAAMFASLIAFEFAVTFS
jgi:hypothetical protein